MLRAAAVNHFVPSALPAEGLGVLLLFRLIDAATPEFFAPDRPIQVTRAPGRLDVMGGFADYSGALVLQLPTAEAASAAIQARSDDQLRLWSPCRDGSRTQRLSTRLGDLGLPDRPIDYREAHAFLCGDPRDRWAGYLLGCLVVLAHECGLRPAQGFDLLLHSDVPEGKGAASSAAVTVAAMRAMAVRYGLELTDRELALLCQRVENAIVGAPCGVMDPMAAAAGHADHLLALRCQPCEVEGRLPVPAGLEFVGLDSGVRHAITGSDYGMVRAGAFVGLRMLAALRGLPMRQHGNLHQAEDPAWRGYLANCPLAAFDREFAARLPLTIRGGEFLQQFGGHADPHTRIDPEREYPVRAPTRHPIAENQRVERFRSLLQTEPTEPVRQELGALMYEAHAGYTACGLGHEVTDFLVEQAKLRAAAGAPLYGAKVTGGGSGGTVVLLGERGKVWYEALRLKKALQQHTGHSAHVFRWSSPGAFAFGHVELRPAQG